MRSWVNTGRTAARLATRALALAVLVLAPAASGRASFINVVPTSLTLAPGDSTTVTIQFTSTESFFLQSSDLAIAYDSSGLSSVSPAVTVSAKAVTVKVPLLSVRL